MIVLGADNKSKIFEVDSKVFEDVKLFLKTLSKEKKTTFSYVDDLGDKIVVIDGKEYVEPTVDDLKAIYSIKKDDFLDEDRVKDILKI